MDQQPTEANTEQHDVESREEQNEREQKQDRHKFSFARLGRKVSIAFAILFRTLLIVLILIGVVFITKDITDSNYSISQFSAPASFQEAGYTSEVIANRVFDKLNRIINTERVADMSKEYKNANAMVDLNVDVAGFGLPIRSITGLLREALGIERRKEISGDIVLDGDTLIFEIRVGGEPDRYKVPLGNSIETSLNMLTSKATEAILKHSNPYVLARYYVYRDSKMCFELGKYLLGKGDPDLEAIGYYAFTGGYVTEGRFELAERKVKEGLKKYPRDLNLRAALATIFKNTDRPAEALAENKGIISMITKETPINRITRSYMNIATVFGDNGQIDSALYYLDIALEIDDKFGDLYAYRGSLYLTAGDTLEAFRCAETAYELGLTNVDLRVWWDIHPKIFYDKRWKELVDRYPDR